jgi:hypothetical protein
VSAVVDPRLTHEVARAVEEMAVTSGACREASDWPWSSRAAAGLVPCANVAPGSGRKVALDVDRATGRGRCAVGDRRFLLRLERLAGVRLRTLPRGRRPRGGSGVRRAHFPDGTPG